MTVVLAPCDARTHCALYCWFCCSPAAVPVPVRPPARRPPPPDRPGFQNISEAPAPDGGAIDVGWLVGPAAGIRGDIAGTSLRAGTATWSADRRITAFWIHRPGPALQWGDHTPDARRPRFVALAGDGRQLFSQLLIEPAVQPFHDG